MGSLITTDLTGRDKAPGSQLQSVILVPWDPDSPEHVDRMVRQRVACGWKHDYVEGWRHQQREGKIGLHWIVLLPRHVDSEQRVQQHIAAFPEEAAPLENTCRSIFSRSISPDPAISSFMPIGHISLDAWSPDSKLEISPSKGIYSLTTFYVSEALQSIGLGGTALRACEEMAAKDFGAVAITLSTIANEECRADSPRRIAMNRPIPKVTLQDWYQRRGYVVYDNKKDAWFDTDPTGKVWGVAACYLKKSLR